MVNIKDYARLFPMESTELVRWDEIDIKTARLMLEAYFQTIKRLIDYFVKLEVDKQQNFSRYICDGRNHVNIISFLAATRENNETSFSIVIKAIRIELQEWNCYDEPTWILWKRYLQDVIDALTLFDNLKVNTRTRLFLKNILGE